MMRSVLIPLSIAIVAVLVVAAGSIGFARHENHVALERAYAMMSDSDQLKVNESTLEDALQFVRKYRGEERSSKPTGTCQPSDCMAETYVSPSFYGRHTWLIPVVKRIGVQVFEFNVTLWIEDGKLTAIEEIFFVPKAVGADVYVEAMTSNPAERNCRHPSFQLHPGFMTSYRERYGTPEFTYWTNARRPQEAPPRLRMNLNCVTTLAGCQSSPKYFPPRGFSIKRTSLKSKPSREHRGPRIIPKQVASKHRDVFLRARRVLSGLKGFPSNVHPSHPAPPLRITIKLRPT